jgi:ribonuclease BN (tRNA processing enzyme)
MKLVMLGTGGYHPNERRHTACLMVPQAGIVLDAGTGFFRVRRLLQARTLDILLTHAHLDHAVGLTYLLSTTWQHQLDSITVHGAADKLAALQEHLLSEHLFPAKLPCRWQPLSAGPLRVGEATVRHVGLAHPGGSIGYRLDWPGRSMAYITDTTAALNAAYVESIRGVNLLVHECNFSDDQQEWAIKTGHSFLTPVVEVARAAAVGRLVLTHFDSLDDSEAPIDLAAARRTFPATELGYDGLEIEF